MPSQLRNISTYQKVSASQNSSYLSWLGISFTRHQKVFTFI